MILRHSVPLLRGTVLHVAVLSHTAWSIGPGRRTLDFVAAGLATSPFAATRWLLRHEI